MPSRLVRSATAVALATSATTFAYVGSAAPAQAAGYDGYCKTSSGVTVVVDFRNLGGGVVIRCSPVGAGATGIDALQAAGIPLQGTRQFGLSTPCRIYGKPTATQELPGGYHESCVRMPPTKAYWSYWHASNGGSWSYSSDGAGNRTVSPGGFEGWAFAEGSNVAPGVAPSRPKTPKPTPKPTHTTTQPPAPPRHTSTDATHDPAPGTSGGSAEGSGGAAGENRTSQPKSAASSKAAAKKAAKKKSAAHKSKAAKAKASKKAKASASKKAKASHSSSASSSGAAAGTSSGEPTNAAGPHVGNSDDMIKDAKKGQSSSINATTVVGGGVLGALAIGGGVVAFIRRRNVGQ